VGTKGWAPKKSRIEICGYGLVLCGSGSGVLMITFLKFYRLKKNHYFLNQKIFNLFINGLHERRLSNKENQSALKREHLTLQSIKFLRFSPFFLSFLPSGIRIHPTRINADPDPHHRFKVLCSPLL
jgi:hypothetical protein